jgi:hypothetical protein
LEQTNTINSKKPTVKLRFTYKELGVFLLLFFLNLKFAAITIIQDRSVVIDLIVYLLLVVTFNYSNWTYKSLIKTGIAIGVYTIINFSQYKLNVLMPLLLIQSVSGISFKRYLRINFLIMGITLLVMYAVYGEGTNWIGFTLDTDRKVRMTFGFSHPNTVALYYYCFMINGMLLVYFSRFKKYVSAYLLLIIPLWYYIYHMTVSRSFLLSMVVLYLTYSYFFLGLITNKKNIFRITSYFYIALLFIFSIITIFFTILKEDFMILNRILSNRLDLYSWFLDKLTIFDFFFGSTAYKDRFIDSSYLHLFFEGGVFFFIGFSVFYILSTINMVNKKEWIPICIIMSFMSYGLMETLLLYSMLIGTNIFWVMLYFYYRNGKMQL